MTSSITRKYTDNALTTLASSINAAATTMAVATGKGGNFPQITGRGTPGANPEFYVITMEDSAGNRERIKCEHRTVASDTLGSAGYPLIRGYGGTVARSWVAGDSVDLRWGKDEAEDDNDKSQADVPARAFGHLGSTTTGLTFGYFGGNLNVDGVVTAIADGTLVLTASQTNYVQRTPAGAVSFNTTGFDADKIALHQVTTDAGGITAVTDKRSANQSVYGASSKSLAAASGTVTLTADEARSPIIELTGAAAGAVDLVFPNVKRNWIIRNNTSGGFNITAKVSGQTGTVLPGAGEEMVYGNGTDIRPVVSDSLIALQANGAVLLALSDFFYGGF